VDSTQQKTSTFHWLIDFDLLIGNCLTFSDQYCIYIHDEKNFNYKNVYRNEGRGWIWCLMVFNATFNNNSVISWWSVLLVEETAVPEENHQPVASHWQTLSHNVISSTPRHKRDSNSLIPLVITSHQTTFQWYWGNHPPSSHCFCTNITFFIYLFFRFPISKY